MFLKFFIKKIIISYRGSFFAQGVIFFAHHCNKYLLKSYSNFNNLVICSGTVFINILKN